MRAVEKPEEARMMHRPMRPIEIGVVGTPAPAAIATEPLLVAAASDLQFAFTEMAELYQKQSGQKVTLTFGSTGLTVKPPKMS